MEKGDRGERTREIAAQEALSLMLLALKMGEGTHKLRKAGSL